jgi:hypothetical protein
MSVAGRIRVPRGERTFAEILVDSKPDTTAVTGPRRTASSIECRAGADCPETFTGPTRWQDYVRHIREAHPQTEPSPSQREPGEPAAPAAPKPSAANAGEKEAPAMATRIPCREGCETADGAPKTFETQQGENVHYARVHGPNAVAPAPKSRRVESNGGGPAVPPDPEPRDIQPTAIPTDVTPPAEDAPSEPHTTDDLEAGMPVIDGVEPRYHGGSIPGFISFDALAPHLEAAEAALLLALMRPLHVRFENGYSVALVDVEEIEVLVQGQRVIYLTAEHRDRVEAAKRDIGILGAIAAEGDAS